MRARGRAPMGSAGLLQAWAGHDGAERQGERVACPDWSREVAGDVSANGGAPCGEMVVAGAGKRGGGSWCR